MDCHKTLRSSPLLWLFCSLVNNYEYLDIISQCPLVFICSDYESSATLNNKYSSFLQRCQDYLENRSFKNLIKSLTSIFKIKENAKVCTRYRCVVVLNMLMIDELTYEIIIIYTIIVSTSPLEQHREGFKKKIKDRDFFLPR